MSSSHEKRNDCSHEKAYRLSSTPYTEIAPCLPLPRLPVFCGALSSDLSLFDNQNFQFIDRPEILAQASRIAALLKDTDVSYLFELLTSLVQANMSTSKLKPKGCCYYLH
ncbi:hypothetical protein AMTR_s00110p00058160 [Amborella trichopoda]|uniref:Uncharacterized protein n=1 Tax=Amborella trichopoda TaxID=13333 RepID=W1NWA4_AMBTC|nr:hypothetical protein AMTR_s00110p00058160 [Amborella trichopoda]